MKPFTGVLFITGLMSCAPASQVALQPAPLFLEQSNIFVEQGDRTPLLECHTPRYRVNTDSQIIKITDKFSFEFGKLPEGVSIFPEARGDGIVLCSRAILSVIPKTYETTGRLFLNDALKAQGKVFLFVKSSVASLDFAGITNPVPKGGKLCVSLLLTTRTQQFVPVPANQISLKFITTSRITSSIEDSSKPICFSAPSDILAGSYTVEIEGVVSGIGFKTEQDIKVQ